MTPFTDICISVRGTREFPIEQYFEQCVNSVVKWTSNYRFIFVDDNSDAVAAEFVAHVASGFPQALLIRTHTQNWFTRAYNKALRLVRTPRAVALNADTVVDSGWLEEMYDVWSEVECANGTPVGLVGSVLSDVEPRRYESTKPPGYVTGHCWLLSMEAMARCAETRGQPGWYLDEINPLMAHIRSDIEICERMNSLGYQTVASFKSRVGHFGGKSWGHRLGLLANITAESLRKIDGY